MELKHEEAKKILSDSGKIAARCLYVSPQLKFYQACLVGHVNRMMFYDRVLEFQSQYTKKSLKYREFQRHVPFGSVALGHFLIELPNFSERLREEYRAYLDWSEKAYAAAIEIAKGEAVVFEFDLSVTDALRGMAEVCFLQGESRSRVLTYKYATFSEQDKVRRMDRLRKKKQEEAEAAGENDDLDDGLLVQELQEGGDQWEE
jgi:hypothetical protein